MKGIAIVGVQGKGDRNPKYEFLNYAYCINNYYCYIRSFNNKYAVSNVNA